MIRLLPRPALLTNVVVGLSLVGGLAFGAAVMSAVLLGRTAMRRIVRV